MARGGSTLVLVMRRLPARVWALAGFVAAVRVAWILYRGPVMSPDSLTYFRWGAAVLSEGLSLDTISSHGIVLYLGTVLWSAFLQAAFGPANAVIVWIVAQTVAVVLGTIPLYLLARDIYGDRVATVACLTYAFLFEAFQWEAYVLSDSFFQALVITTLYAIRRAEADGGRWRHLRTGLLVFMTFLRPTGFLLGGCYLAWRIIGKRPSRRTIVAGSIGALILVLIAPFVLGFAEGMGEQYGRKNSLGMIVDDDPQLALPPPSEPRPDLVSFVLANPLYFAAQASLRFFAFFLPLVPRYSTVHIALNVVTLLPVLVAGVAVLVRSIARPGFPRFLAAVVLAFAGFHALTLLDYDFRYRNPVLPILVLFFAFGLERIWDRARLSAGRAAPQGNP